LITIHAAMSMTANAPHLKLGHMLASPPTFIFESVLDWSVEKKVTYLCLLFFRLLRGPPTRSAPVSQLASANS
jgi:hypothetical protein